MTFFISENWVCQTRRGGVYPKTLVFWWQEVKGQFWPILSLILFLFCIMLFNNKLSNLSLSITFCFPIFRRVCVSLRMSKIQKRFIFGQNLRVMEIYWTLWNISWIQSTKKSLLSSFTAIVMHCDVIFCSIVLTWDTFAQIYAQLTFNALTSHSIKAGFTAAHTQLH